MKRLISSPAAAGIDMEDVRACPGVIVELRDDVLRDLMRTSAPVERPRLTERADSEHPRRRVCV